MISPLMQEYGARYDRSLVSVAIRLERLISDHIFGLPRIDRVSARAKSPESFYEKAQRKDPTGGPLYADPMTQIQDQIAARVIVYYKADIIPVSECMLRYFQPIEKRIVVPDSQWKFGYFGMHLVLALPGDVIPVEMDPNDAPRFFELQIKTLFQHAWSEANHDLGYKPVEDLTDDQLRQLAFTSAQSWGADRVFDELFQDLVGKAGRRN